MHFSNLVFLACTVRKTIVRSIHRYCMYSLVSNWHVCSKFITDYYWVWHSYLYTDIFHYYIYRMLTHILLIAILYPSVLYSVLAIHWYLITIKYFLSLPNATIKNMSESFYFGLIIQCNVFFLQIRDKSC